MSAPTLFLSEPFAALWSGRDPFVAVEALQGQVFRELEARRTDWQPLPPRYTRGVLAKYQKLVKSAALGAVTS